jgi:hypothetical protein
MERMDRERFMKIVSQYKNAKDNGLMDINVLNSMLLTSYFNLDEGDKILVLLDALPESMQSAPPPAIVVNPTPDIVAPDTFERMNQIEMMKLKTWLFKSFALTIFFCFVVFIGVMIYVNYVTGDGQSGWFEDMFKIFKVIMSE